MGAAGRVLREALTLIHLETAIEAPPERVFDLSRSVSEHLLSLADSAERVVSAPAHDLLTTGDRVTWEARHGGRRWRLSVEITELDPPHGFVDEQTSGPFRSMRHRHRFEPRGPGTLMLDDFEFELDGALAGPASRLAGWYLRRLLAGRNRHLKSRAEGAGDSRPGG